MYHGGCSSAQSVAERRSLGRGNIISHLVFNQGRVYSVISSLILNKWKNLASLILNKWKNQRINVACSDELSWLCISCHHPYAAYWRLFNLFVCSCRDGDPRRGSKEIGVQYPSPYILVQIDALAGSSEATCVFASSAAATNDEGKSRKGELPPPDLCRPIILKSYEIVANQT